MGHTTDSRPTTRLEDVSGASLRKIDRIDRVVVESPLTIAIGEEVLATTMRTPGHDLDLAAGWLVSEAGLHKADDILSMRAFAASLSAKEPTSTLFSHTSTTHVTQTLVSTSTHSHFALRSTSHLEHAISLVLTTLLFSLSFPPTPSVVTRLLRSVCTLPTTMSFVS